MEKPGASGFDAGDAVCGAAAAPFKPGCELLETRGQLEFAH
jgi:hypothetical protein